METPGTQPSRWRHCGRTDLGPGPPGPYRPGGPGSGHWQGSSESGTPAAAAGIPEPGPAAGWPGAAQAQLEAGEYVLILIIVLEP